MHLGALRREQVGERVADRDPAPAAGMQRAGGIRRDELEVHALTGENVATSVPRAVGNHRGQRLVEPRRLEIEVQEARPGDLDPVEVGWRRGFERAHELGRRVPWRDARGLGHLEGDVRHPVAVLALLRRLDHNTACRLVEAGFGERSAHGEEDVVANHG